MSFNRRIELSLILLVGLLFPLLAAEPVQTAADIQSLKEKYQAEREQAVKAKFPAATLERADELAQRGEAASKAAQFKVAARYYRDARWQLPYLPKGLPEHVVRVFGESRIRHADRINAIAYNPDGTQLASCSKDGTAKIWDLGNGREISTYRGHTDQADDPTKKGTNVFSVTDIAFHPKKKLVASASGNQVHLWDPETGKFDKTILNLGKNDKPIKPIAFSPDGKFLAVGADDGILRVVDVETGKITYSSPPRNARIETLAYSPNGNMIVVGDSSMFVAVYAPSQPTPLLMSMEGVELGEVRSVAFTADSTGVFACGRDPKARLLAGPKPDGKSPASGSTRLREFSGHVGSVSSLGATPDGSFLITGGDDSTIRVWEVHSAKQLRVFQCYQKRDANDSGKGVTALAIRKDGKQIASGSNDGAMRLWDLTAVDDHKVLEEAADSLWTVAYSPDGKRLAAAGNDKTIRVYNTETLKLEASLPGAKTPITSLAFFPDSNRLAAAGGDRVVVVWDVAKASAIKELPGHESVVLALAVAADGKRIISGSADRTIRAFSPNVDKALWSWPARSAVCSIAIQAGGKLLAAGLADGSLVMLDISGDTPKEISTFSAHVAGVSGLAFSDDGERLASVGGDGILRVWTVGENAGLTQIARFEGQAKPGAPGVFPPLSGVAFARDSRFVAAVGADLNVRIWDIVAKNESRSFFGHTDWVTAVAISPDGRFLASIGVEKDRKVRIFDLPPPETPTSGGHLLEVKAVAISPDGKIAATAGADQSIKLWDIASGKEVGTLIGGNDKPFAITFLGKDALVMGGAIESQKIGRLNFWATKQARSPTTATTGEVYCIVSNSEGSKLAVWVARGAMVGNIKNHAYEIYDNQGKLLSVLSDSGREVSAAIFSPDLAWAVAGDNKGNIGIWDLAKQKRIGDESLWPLFENPLRDLGITPDKKLIVAADDTVVKVADIAKRVVYCSITPHKAEISSLIVSPTGKTFATVSSDQEIKTWSLDPADLKEPKPTRTWTLPVGVNGVAYTPDGKQIITANKDGTAYLLELP
jgi:WD40 repeat protein